jgi:S1-C subfamily serine protease
MKADGAVCPVKAVLAANAAGDVAIVQLGGTGFVPLAVAPAAPVGSDVFVISHPDSRFFTLSRGIVARYTTMTRGRKKNATMLQITAEYAKGSSGGPVLNTAGEVVGMVSSTMSVYYNDDHGKQQDLQMVFNDCVTSRQILDLIKSP